MTVYGIGAYYGDEIGDVSDEFLSEGVTSIRWTPEESPPLHQILEYIRMGDIIYIKSLPPDIGLIIKAVGIATDEKVSDYSCGRGVKVKWIWTGEERLGQLEDKCDHLRRGTLFEEPSAEVSTTVINLLLSELPS